ncbi:hypothetical protein JOY44_12970 [Phormidium sp. CLA17]|uniref:DUF5331 domain-containing protein n=1 Tax=Leptolyngbya sp. Cla-17 TaxID=2803751 RepID=UPI001492D788|nr:DUF5331 domain-containing protein [Leptolyngbya sp. Cla-17]MBM0742517.1 hypothetical protein [Leptolyngbya sp. Cla-17]
MNTQQFRQSVKKKWLDYYVENRVWIARLQIWVNCDGQRRPSSSFILATLSALEPQLNQLLPLIVDLSNNPDRIVAALDLNFNPDEHLKAVAKSSSKALNNGNVKQTTAKDALKFLPAASSYETDLPTSQVSHLISKIDESCEGGRSQRSQPTKS